MLRSARKNSFWSTFPEPSESKCWNRPSISSLLARHPRARSPLLNSLRSMVPDSSTSHCRNRFDTFWKFAARAPAICSCTGGALAPSVILKCIESAAPLFWLGASRSLARLRWTRSPLTKEIKLLRSISERPPERSLNSRSTSSFRQQSKPIVCRAWPNSRRSMRWDPSESHALKISSARTCA